MENHTVIELSSVDNIVGIKDATGDISRIKAIKNEVNGNFSFISGDDLSFVEFLEEGGNGVISVLMRNDIFCTFASYMLKK